MIGIKELQRWQWFCSTELKRSLQSIAVELESILRNLSKDEPRRHDVDIFGSNELRRIDIR